MEDALFLSCDLDESNDHYPLVSSLMCLYGIYIHILAIKLKDSPQGENRLCVWTLSLTFRVPCR